MRTTLNLKNDVMKKAMRLTGAKTKTSLIHYALEELIRRENFKKLLEYGGKTKIKYDPDVSRGRK